MKLFLVITIMTASYFGYSQWRKHQIKEAVAYQKEMVDKIKVRYEQEVSSINYRLENDRITLTQANKLKQEALQKLRAENQKILETSLNKIIGKEIDYKKNTSIQKDKKIEGL